MAFWAPVAVGVFCLVLSALFEEMFPKSERYKDSAFGSIRNLGIVVKNKGLTSFLRSRMPLEGVK